MIGIFFKKKKIFENRIFNSLAFNLKKTSKKNPLFEVIEKKLHQPELRTLKTINLYLKQTKQFEDDSLY